MNDEVMQEENSELSPEEAKAALGLSTRLTEQFMMSQVPQEAEQETPEAPVEPQEAPTEELPEETEEEPQEEEKEDSLAKLELSIVDRLDKIRKELKDDQKDQVDSLRKEIENALNQAE